MFNQKEYLKEYNKKWRKSEAQKKYWKSDSYKESHKKSQQKYYQNNKEKIKLIKEERRDWIRQYKSNLKCERCGYNENVVALDFHHTGDKDIAISQMYTQGVYPNAKLEDFKKKFFEEREKCIILCANCHRIEHYDKKLP